MEHIVDQADPEYTYCDFQTVDVNAAGEPAVTVDAIDHDTICDNCIREFNNRY